MDQFELDFKGRAVEWIACGYGRERKESMMIPGCLSGKLNIKLKVKFFSKLERQMETGEYEFCFEYVSFEKPVRYSKGGLVWLVTT